MWTHAQTAVAQSAGEHRPHAVVIGAGIGGLAGAITLDGRAATGVSLASGEIIPADVMVSNADVAWTYRYSPPKSARKPWTDTRIERSRHSMSMFVWYFGTKRQYPDVPDHTMLVGPRYRELLADIFKHEALATEFSLYLKRPTATDPAIVPAGHDAFYVFSPVPHLDGETDWRGQAEVYRQHIAMSLSETVLPGFESEIVTSRIMTPLDFRERLLSFEAAAFSLDPVLSQSAWFRAHNRSEDVERLNLVGAGTHSGACVPGVICSARVLDRIVPDAAAIV